MTSSSNSSQSTLPTGRVLWEELLVLSSISLVITSKREEFLSPVNHFFFLLEISHSVAIHLGLY